MRTRYLRGVAWLAQIDLGIWLGSDLAAVAKGRPLVHGQSQHWTTLASQLPGTVFVLWTLGSDRHYLIKQMFPFGALAASAARPLSSVIGSKATAPWMSCCHLPCPRQAVSSHKQGLPCLSVACHPGPQTWWPVVKLPLTPFCHHVLESYFLVLFTTTVASLHPSEWSRAPPASCCHLHSLVWPTLSVQSYCSSLRVA